MGFAKIPASMMGDSCFYESLESNDCIFFPLETSQEEDGLGPHCDLLFHGLCR